MYSFIAPRAGSIVQTLRAQVQDLLLLVAIAAILAIASQPSVVHAAEAEPGTDLAGGASVALVALSSVDCRTTAGRGSDADDGEDHFDEGDDEFDCAGDGDEESCDDDGDDCTDGDGDDDGDDGCANFDDGEDRCLDHGEDRFDEGDDEFVAMPQPTTAQPEAVDARPSSASSAAPMDLSVPGALAAILGLGAGGVWLLRRGRI